jgi:DNA-directed RNA polymerase specialized sigma24 family protein
MSAMSSQASAGDAPGLFPPTRWSVVLAATQRHSPAATQALEDLCRAYWQPLYAYVRRCGHAPHDAQDLTQEFFARLLEHHWLDTADRDKGRLRTFLIVALKHFLHKEWRRASAQKRGGGRGLVELDTACVESLPAGDAHGLAPDQAYDRQWALTLLDLTLKRLLAEFVTAGRAGDFEILKGCLMAAHGTIDYADLATRLGGNPGAARVAVHRLRKRFREIYREEISQTLAAGADLEDELRHLAAALTKED